MRSHDATDDVALPIPPYDEGALRLRDGRTLAYAQFGDPAGTPVLWFHGTPGARRQLPRRTVKVAQARGVRVVGVDRPGVGGSSTDPDRSLLSWARDVEELADHLGLRRFGTAGLSGGGPHVLAVAATLPDRVTAAALLGGMAPLTGPEAPAATPPGTRHVLRALRAARRPLGDGITAALRNIGRREAELVFPLVLRLIPPEDRAVVSQPEIREMFLWDLVEGSRQRFRAQIQDVAAFGADWGFSLRALRVPVRLWHGSEDRLVPLEHAHHMAELIPDAELTVIEGEGHFAGFMRPQEVLDWLCLHAGSGDEGRSRAGKGG